MVLYLDIQCFIILNETNTRHLANCCPFLLIREEAFVELFSLPVLLIVAQMLRESYFEYKRHEILDVFNLQIKVFL